MKISLANFIDTRILKFNQKFYIFNMGEIETEFKLLYVINEHGKCTLLTHTVLLANSLF